MSIGIVCDLDYETNFRLSFVFHNIVVVRFLLYAFLASLIARFVSICYNLSISPVIFIREPPIMYVCVRFFLAVSLLASDSAYFAWQTE